jgi:hypothetical protein
MLSRVMSWSTLAVLVMSATFLHVANAHHSFAMFDKNKFTTIKGTVRKVEWKNPHVYLFVDVPDGKGATKLYALEGSSPNELGRWGWKINSAKAGDAVSVGIFPLRDGQPGGLIFSVTLANGVVLKAN